MATGRTILADGGEHGLADLQICLLGSFQVCWDFAPVAHGAWRDPLAARLLKAVLVLRPEPLPADLASHWAGKEAYGARLVAALEAANRVLHPGASLQVEGGLIRFLPGPACWVDVDALAALQRSGAQALARGEILKAVLALQEADALYQGDLLEELQEPWVAEPRRRFQALYTEILDQLAEGHAVLARYQDAVGFCHKALAHDPLREATYQRLMVYYFYLGDMPGVAEAYQRCVEALAGVGRRISPETADLWQHLSQQAPGSPADMTAAARQEPPRLPRNR